MGNSFCTDIHTGLDNIGTVAAFQLMIAEVHIEKVESCPQRKPSAVVPVTGNGVLSFDQKFTEILQPSVFNRRQKIQSFSEPVGISKMQQAVVHVFRLFDTFCFEVIGKARQSCNIIGLTDKSDFFTEKPAERIFGSVPSGHVFRHLVIINIRGKTSGCRALFVVIGGEKRGISRAILDKADKIVRIDYARNFKGSLPSVAAASIISFEISRKNKQY